MSTISAVLEQTFAGDGDVSEALKRTPTLLILNNLETISDQALQELLTAASGWSQAGDSRVLLTSRRPDTGHPDYAVQGTFKHRRIKLEGLGSASFPDDALDLFARINLLPSAQAAQVPPPSRDELIRLFDRVQFHPLSICVLVQQLKTRTAKQLDRRLEQLLSSDAVSLVADQGTPKSLIASLHLSLERLSEAERHAVGRLGVFQGGAFEDDLLAITELGTREDEREELRALLAAADRGDPRALAQIAGVDLPEDAEIPAELLATLKESPEFQQHIERLRAELAGLPEQPTNNLWPGLRRSLEAAGLIEAESVPGVGPPFLRFHPTLAPMLWAGLDQAKRDALLLAHRQRYYQRSVYLHTADNASPYQARAIARRELPNLLHAVHQALQAGDPDAVEFADKINWFLGCFGMTGEAGALMGQAEQAGGKRGSHAWFLAQSGRGEQLYHAGRAGEAAEIFSDILTTLADEPGYDLAATLARLGRCHEAGGRPDMAETTYRQASAVVERLEQDDPVKSLRGTLHTGLADVLRTLGAFAAAREEYELGLEVDKELDDPRGQAVSLGQLGTLALLEGDLVDAVKRYREALELVRRLGEPAAEAVALHQLGIAFARAKQWEQAEHHFRESARLEEQRRNVGGAVTTWNALASLSKEMGKPEAAETWYRKAIEGSRQVGQTRSTGFALSNLAKLLRKQPRRLAEARQLAEESLAIGKTLDPSAAEIWTTYTILAQIADQQSEPEQAAEYRRLAREAKRKFAGTAHEMKRHLPIIVATCQAAQEPDRAVALSASLSQMEERGWANLVGGIRRILSGERNAEVICKDLDLDDSMIVETILSALDDPSVLKPLLSQDGDSK